MIPFNEFRASDFVQTFCGMFGIETEDDYKAEVEHIHKEMEDEPRIMYLLLNGCGCTFEEANSL